MRFRFVEAKLRRLYETGKGRYSADVIKAFFRVMGHIDQAIDERDLYALKGLHYEQLKGDRKGQHSLRLNQQFRLVIVSMQEQGTVILILELVDYH